MSRTEIIISVFGLFLRVKLIKTIKSVATLGNSVCLEIFDHIHQKVRLGSFSSFLGYLSSLKNKNALITSEWMPFKRSVQFQWLRLIQKYSEQLKRLTWRFTFHSIWFHPDYDSTLILVKHLKCVWPLSALYIKGLITIYRQKSNKRSTIYF